MKAAFVALALMWPASAYASSPDKFGEICVGTETISSEKQPEKMVPYSMTFSIDLASGHYCYAECKAWQTHKISDATSNPIKLADVRGAPTERLLTFDRRTGKLTDHQVVTLFGKVEGFTTATCQAAPFHAPD
ncbi:MULTISPECIES: hypothetical protein [unclassified Sphingomonas]|uniref:hypothetical protein n=1 Tax=unclassified Sphingomonas TaxID=196159 RepID=UPI001AC1879C|nr:MULTISPECIES: hypothetical protein [unclassified Sphingomonas]MBN8849312.1 hypothetical protein [Sphingomonas sp.]